jgi:hypothetical protein
MYSRPARRYDYRSNSKFQTNLIYVYKIIVHYERGRGTHNNMQNGNHVRHSTWTKGKVSKQLVLQSLLIKHTHIVHDIPSLTRNDKYIQKHPSTIKFYHC